MYFLKYNCYFSPHYLQYYYSHYIHYTSYGNKLRHLKTNNSHYSLLRYSHSSKHGIGAVLFQKKVVPIEYASRTLTPSERNWAQIERKAVYGFERVHQYTYGRPVKVENDHKALAAVSRKPLSQAHKRPQDIMMRYHRYDVNFIFIKGTD